MTKTDLVQKYAVAGVADVLSCFGIPTAIASQLYQDILEKRNAEALEILRSEIRQGNFENINQHDAISIIARFQRDAMEGVARNNLRLMAKVINGMAEKKELTAPSFLKYANVLASLTEDEITVLGIMAKDASGRSNRTILGEVRRWDITEQKNPGEHELKKLVPNYKLVQQSLMRTALVEMSIKAKTTPKTDGSGSFYAGTGDEVAAETIYCLTPFMGEILKYTEFFTECPQHE